MQDCVPQSNAHEPLPVYYHALADAQFQVVEQVAERLAVNQVDERCAVAVGFLLRGLGETARSDENAPIRTAHRRAAKVADGRVGAIPGYGFVS